MESRQPKSQVFAKSLENTVSKLNEKQVELVKAAFGESNDRQKLKTIKRILQSNAESELKTIFKDKFQQVILREYIFGNVQAKPTVLNIFKVLTISQDIFFNMNEELQTFQQIKLTIEVVETLTIANRLSKQSKQKLLNSQLFAKIYTLLLQEMRKAVESIAKNQFRTKWLDYFVQVLRCVNYMIKYTGQQHQQFKQSQQKYYKLAEQCSNYSYLLSKQVISQLYIILLSMNKNYAMPQSNLQKIHYLHACTVVKGQNTLKPLLKLGSQLKDTEQKSQLTPILLKSFQQYFEQGKKKGEKVDLDQQLKINAFDWAISLFDVGRSIYSYLEEITDIIITHGGVWSLEGNFTRKFFIAKVALKHVTSKHILALWPNCLEDCFVQSGNMTMAYVTDCAQALLTKIYEQLGKDYSKWMEIWIEPYKKTLLSPSRSHIRGITDFINPILLKINSSNSSLLRQVSLLPQDNLNSRLGMISLLKCYKQIGKIQSKHNVFFEQQQRKKQLQKKQKKQKKKNEADSSSTQLSQPQRQKETKIIQQRVTNFNPKQQNISFIHLDDSAFELDCDFLLDLLLSNDSMTALQTLQFLITTRKPSILILPQQMNLILHFYKNCLKTSMPEYRKSYLNLTKRLLQRFRKNYEKDLKQQEQQKTNKKKVQKATQYFEEFIDFLNKLIQICFFNIYPDAIFEIANPGLQILQLILNLFGPKGCEIRKGTYIEPCQLLVHRTKFFSQRNFYNLVICLQSSYESIRSIAHEIIKNFTKFSQEGMQILHKMWFQALQNTNKLSIKSYEFACRILTYISSLKIQSKCLIPQIPQKYSLSQLNVCDYLIQVLRNRYEIFKKQFVDQGQIYYKNLIHGILTCFSYILEQLSQKNDFNEKNLQDYKLFLAEFFIEMTKILNFSVEISSANISTVVLDTIANASQTDKKMTVDCRGHFLVQKKQKDQNSTGKTIGSYLDSTALLTSMQNQQQGIQNTLVVSFYLLTRESGLVFQSIGSLMSNNVLAKHVPKKELIQLVNTYFFALINLKHMGSVDRISNGLSKMAKVIFDQQDTDLRKVPQQLLNQLLQFLNDGKFTNILRRSAGVPYAFSCLLKSQAVKRKLLIQKTINCLLNLSKQESNSPLELRIHSLNILKKLFQDSDLKQDLDIYLSQAFISSIRGFTSQEWGVRNSSLMLFSVLANRTLGIRPTYNLLQFFHKCPDLLAFISKSLSQKKAPTMYPPLYPIVLLLSRLLPFDLRERARLSVKGGTNKQMRKQQLLNLQPLVRQAGNNHNYMGRVMTAKAILPFMHLSSIIPHCLSLLQSYITNLHNNTITNNNEHYRLTQCYQLLISYSQIINSNSQPQPQPQLQSQSQTQSQRVLLNKQTKQQIHRILDVGVQYIESAFEKVSPTVHDIYIRIYQHFMNLYCRENGDLNWRVLQRAQRVFDGLTQKKNRIGDLGHSLMYKSCILLIASCNTNLLQSKANNMQIGHSFIRYLNCENSLRQDQQTDYQILCLVLQKIVQLISKYQNLSNQQNVGQTKYVGQKQYNILLKSLASWLTKIQLHKIKNDNIIIKILCLYSANPQIVSLEQLPTPASLSPISKSSQNKHMKVSIFEYLLSISYHPNITNNEQYSNIRKQANQMLQSLLDLYSNPEQLEDLRECCILYLEKCQKINGRNLIMMIRVLEDEEYQIRKRAAIHVSRILGIKPCNEQVVTKQLLHRLFANESYIQTLKTPKKDKTAQCPTSIQLIPTEKLHIFQTLLSSNSDYQIRIKNNNQQRIFSYDKPNKYRTDINTLHQVTLLMPSALLKSSSLNQATNEKDEKQVQQLLKRYKENVMERNQYQFQRIIREMVKVGGKEESLGLFLYAAGEHEILWQIYQKLVQGNQ